ncbi:MAG: RNA methyltransferase [Verrucomicrobiales bacterium]|nr:RNA methyltransferase [Verrucomicrobiales bacterium]
MTTEEELTEYLGSYVTENKREKIAAVLAGRTRHVTIMLENIYRPHNASACLRTCDCLGVQDVHIVEGENEYRSNDDIALGASKWLSLHRYHQTASALETMKRRGYRIVATTPNKNGYEPCNLPLDKPVAILFGTEEQGLTKAALEAADDTMKLPMHGFTQSYNISVTVAIVLSRLVERIRESELDWHLSDEAVKELTLDFYRRIVKRHDLLEENFWEERETSNPSP